MRKRKYFFRLPRAEQIRLKAPAKINLSLDVISKRADGMHNISSIMQSVSLFDEIIIRKTNLPGVKIYSNIPWLALSDENLVLKVATDIMEEYKIDCGLTIKLFKRIPIGAGLAGGSADCAATLRGLIKLFGLPISFGQACRMSAKYGADVPFCYMGGTVLATGIGNILEKLPNHPPAVVLLAKPKASISTTKMYHLIDKNKFLSNYSYKNQAILNGIEHNNVYDIAHNLYNVFENVVVDVCPNVLSIKDIMLENRALGASMSGSGPTVFGYFKNFISAKKAADAVKERFSAAETFIVRTLNYVPRSLDSAEKTSK